MSVRRIELVIHDERFEAALLEREAPRTCEIVWQVLPLEAELRHAHLAGPALTAALPIDRPPVENPYALAIPPGAVLFDVRQQPVAIDGAVLPCELIIVTGDGARMMNWAGFAPCNYFAQVAGDLDRLNALGRRIATHGFTTLRARSLPA